MCERKEIWNCVCVCTFFAFVIIAFLVCVFTINISDRCAQTHTRNWSLIAGFYLLGPVQFSVLNFSYASPSYTGLIVCLNLKMQRYKHSVKVDTSVIPLFDNLRNRRAFPRLREPSQSSVIKSLYMSVYTCLHSNTKHNKKHNNVSVPALLLTLWAYTSTQTLLVQHISVACCDFYVQWLCSIRFDCC